MEKKIDCRAIQPIKVGDVRVEPGEQVELPESQVNEQVLAGRVAITTVGTEAFTPVESAEGVVDVQQVASAPQRERAETIRQAVAAADAVKARKKRGK